ncbi:MAG: hypothetical protein NC203_09365 [Firmicutes bacterium]|nr:hypothetical protein [[Eubacterium] siraeum]MCM1488562.1 hypothetical protein [Bacillota bacterium]
MKKKMITLFTLTSLLLTGCAWSAMPADGEKLSDLTEGAENGDTSQSLSVTDAGAVTDIGTAEIEMNIPEETFLIGLDNKGVALSDIKTLTLQDGTEISGEDLSLDSFDKDSFFSAECEGFCYLADPLGVAENSIDNADTFKAPEMQGIVEETFDREFKRYNVGDKYGDLTVKKASVCFDAGYYNTECFGWDPMLAGKDIDFPQVFYREQYVEFEGEIDLTGYVIVNESSDYFPEYEGIMAFMIDGKSSPLPIADASVSLGEEGGFFTFSRCGYMGMYGDDAACFVDEYGPIWLGYTDDVPSDTSGLNAYPNITKVNVTLENIVMPCYKEMPTGSSYISADVKKLEVLS